MKVIDLLNKIANGELKFEQEFKHDGFINNMEMFSNEYLLNEEILNNKIEIIEEVEDIGYEVIEEIEYKPRKVQNAINALIRNQKKILERLDNEK